MNELKLKRISQSKLFLLIVIIISMFTCFFNPLQYPRLLYDEGSYIGKAMHLLVAHSPQEGTTYFNPYFGQIFLGGILWLAGYSHLSQILMQGNVIDSVESLWLAPRLLTGTLGVIDSVDRHLKFRLGMVPNSGGEDLLTIKEAVVVFPVS